MFKLKNNFLIKHVWKLPKKNIVTRYNNWSHIITCRTLIDFLHAINERFKNMLSVVHNIYIVLVFSIPCTIEYTT